MMRRFILLLPLVRTDGKEGVFSKQRQRKVVVVDENVIVIVSVLKKTRESKGERQRDLKESDEIKHHVAFQ